jgi:hypothetical protein
VHGQAFEIVPRDPRGNVTLKLEDFIKVLKKTIEAD